MPIPRLLAALLLSMVVHPAFAQSPDHFLMPMPQQMANGDGELTIDAAFTISANASSDARLHSAAERFLQNLTAQTGILLTPQALVTEKAVLSITSDSPGSTPQKLGEDESYSLTVSSSGAELKAPTTLGVLRGMETFLQLIKPGANGFVVPAVTIHDHPRFPWRGLLIDVSRHFIPINVLKRNLDSMAAVKMNVFHWHLSEDQGFRVESKIFPRLQQMGSDAQFYTQQQITDLIAYAHDRGIRVVPEFDLPGHSTSWFVGYPQLSSGDGPYSIERKWGIFDPAMDPTKDSTYEFLDKFIGEMAKLFPDAYFHVGGDEVNGNQWNSNPRIQAFMKMHQLKDDHDLQAYFNTRLLTIVKKHGKHMEGWDEVLHPELPKDIVVQSWRGQKALAAAARQGFKGILSNGYYIDLMQPASQHYVVDPLSGDGANLTSEEAARVMGGEACMWSEFVSPENIDSRIWPRTAAIAERLWSSQEVKDLDSMYRRLAPTSDWLGRRGATHQSSYRPMLERIIGPDGVPALKTLADVLEPVKGYRRGQLRKFTSQTPLNRLVDATRPESDVARGFNAAVDRLMAGKALPDDAATIRSWLEKWRNNDAALQPRLGSFLTTEVGPLSSDLAALATAGLHALDTKEKGGTVSADWLQQQKPVFDSAAQPKGELLIMVLPGISRLAGISPGVPQRSQE